MKEYTAPKMEILTPEMGIVIYDPYYGPHRIIRVIPEDFSKINLRVLAEKYTLDLRDPCERLYSVKEIIEDEQRKAAIDVAMTAFEEDLTATTWETLKRKKSKKRRQDKKFKAKSLKKFLRETNHLPSFEEAEAFFRNNRRHPNRRKSTLSIKIVNENIEELLEEAEDIIYDEGALLYEDEPWYVYNPETKSWDFDDNLFEYEQMLSDEYGEEDAHLEEEKRAE